MLFKKDKEKKHRLELYLIYDRISGEYSAPLTAVDRAQAISYFTNSMLALSANPDRKTNGSDYELYYVGDYNNITGAITPFEKIYVMTGENKKLKEVKNGKKKNGKEKK